MHESKTRAKSICKRTPGYFKHWIQVRDNWGSTVETYRRALSQLVSGHHLDIEVFGLRLASGLDEPLQHLKANKDRRQQGHGSSVRQNYIQATCGQYLRI